MQESVLHKHQHTIILTMDDEHIHKGIEKDDDFYEHHMLEFIRENLCGGTFIDCGANFGNHTVFFSKFCADKVIAIEPVPHNYELLIKNIVDNNCTGVYPVNIGVGSSNYFASFQKTEDQRWSQCSLNKGGGIPVVTIDSMNLDSCSLIKIDCEEMEADIIIGALSTINKFKPEIFVEIWTDAQLNGIADTLAIYGYELKERYNHAPTYHFSTKESIPVTYTRP